MRYADLVATYERLDGTASNHELAGIVADALTAAPEADLPRVVTLLRGDPFAAWQSAELGLSSNLTTTAISKATGIDEDEIEVRWRETGDLGSAAAWAIEHDRQQTLVSRHLTVRDVHETLQDVAAYEGEGSQAKRIETIAGLLADADPPAGKYIVRTVLGHLRLGVGEGTIRDAITEAFLADRADEEAFQEGVAAVERAFQVTNDYRRVSEVARDDGIDGLASMDVAIGRPLRVMLAQKVETLNDGLAAVAADDGGAPALVEYKLDGFRIQVHVDGSSVTVFTRRLEDVTRQFPDVVERVRACLDVDECIVEGEVVGVDPETGDPLPFQELSRRIKRKYDIQAMTQSIPVRVHLFDLLYLDGESYLDAPLASRLNALEANLKPAEDDFRRVRNRRTSDHDTAAAFYERALEASQEGVVLKNLDAPYQPGARVGTMVKVKPTMEPLDLTVVRAKWSEGRRSNNLGRLYLACRDPETDAFREVGRLSTGFSDAELAEMTARLEPHIREETGREVVVEPSEVIAVAYEELQASPEYDAGFALRFPRFEGFRDDLGLDDIETIDRIEARYEAQ